MMWEGHDNSLFRVISLHFAASRVSVPLRILPRPFRVRVHPRRGQALVEFALCITLLLALLLGMFDVGIFLTDHLAVTSAAHQGALAAASAATRPQADCNALAAIALTTRGQTGLTVTRIIIYQAGSDGHPLGGPGSTGYANVYAGNPGCPNPLAPPMPQVANWPITGRNDCFGAANTLGIEIDYTYTWQTSVIALAPLQVADSAAMPLASDMSISNC